MKRARTVSRTRSTTRSPVGALALPRDDARDEPARRLAEALQQRTSEYRTDATVDLTMIDALLEHEGPAAARSALDGHAASLETLLENLHAAVAQAAVERDVRELLRPPPRPLRERIGAHVSSLAGAAALLLALVAAGPKASDPEAVLAGGDRVASTSEAEATEARPRATTRRSTPASARRVVRERLLRVADPRARSLPRDPAGGEAFVRRLTTEAVRSVTAAPAAAPAADTSPRASDDAGKQDDLPVSLPKGAAEAAEEAESVGADATAAQDATKLPQSTAEVELPTPVGDVDPR